MTTSARGISSLSNEFSGALGPALTMTAGEEGSTDDWGSPAAHRLGLLTAGADSPGLNAAIRAAVHRGVQGGYQIYGLLGGWPGLLDGDARRIDETTVRNILPLGGTILGTSRLAPAGEVAPIKHRLTELGLRGLIVVGDREALATAHGLAREGLPVIGVPETMDNDVAGTDYCIGFDSAVTTVADALDKLHTTASAHHRVMVVEVMGRATGWVALAGGCAGGAHCILVPEIPFAIDEVAEFVARRGSGGTGFSIVVVAEGVDCAAAGVEMASSPPGTAPDATRPALLAPRRPTPGELIGESIERLTGLETRVTVLGHVQRGGSPTAYDRLMASRFGVAAADAAREGRWGTMAALQNNQVVLVPLAAAAGPPRATEPALVELAGVLTHQPGFAGTRRPRAAG
ncbi:MAG: ATP-dependent 6-phosphofructokinase [Chloroflexota bacterium]